MYLQINDLYNVFNLLYFINVPKATGNYHFIQFLCCKCKIEEAKFVSPEWNA